MGAADIRIGICLGGQKGCANVIKAPARFQEPSRHLRLTSEAAEINHSARMREGLCADGAGVGSSVGNPNSALSIRGGRWFWTQIKSLVGRKSFWIGRGFRVWPCFNAIFGSFGTPIGLRDIGSHLI
jgi:hypothetical protein